MKHALKTLVVEPARGAWAESHQPWHTSHKSRVVALPVRQGAGPNRPVSVGVPTARQSSKARTGCCLNGVRTCRAQPSPPVRRAVVPESAACKAPARPLLQARRLCSIQTRVIQVAARSWRPGGTFCMMCKAGMHASERSYRRRLQVTAKAMMSRALHRSSVTSRPTMRASRCSGRTTSMPPRCGPCCAAAAPPRSQRHTPAQRCTTSCLLSDMIW